MDRRHYLGVITGVMGGLAGCTGSEDEPEQAIQDEDEDGDDGDDGGSDGDGESEGGSSSEAEDVTAAVGDLVDGDQLQLVVEAFERDVEISDFVEPDPGNEFVVASLAMKNSTDGYLTVSNFLQARVRDDEDYQYEQAIVGAENTFNDGQFAPGEVERGTVVFEVPEEAAGLKLVFDFDVSLFGGIDRATIDLETTADEIHRLEQSLGVEIYGPGDAVEYGDVEIAVNETRVEDELGTFAEPDEGNEYVIVDISITNGTGEEKRFSTILQMMLKDGEGYTYQEDLSATANLDRAFDEGTPLGDGETRRGELVYEVAEGLSPLYWVFEFEVFAQGDKTFWQLR